MTVTITQPSLLFVRDAPRYMDKLIADFGVTPGMAAAVVGNAGHESNGFRDMQEKKPLGGGRGGLGPYQWTGPRRRAYEEWLGRFKAKPGNFEVDYAFLFRELIGPEKAAIPALKRASGLRAQVIAFEVAYERAGVKHYDSRLVWAERALAVFNARILDRASSTSPVPAPPAPMRPVVLPPSGPAPVKLGQLIDYLFG